MFKKVTILLFAGSLGLAGCVSPEDYETDPVHLSTPKGVVTCQLYQADKVIWDRAINRPESMTVEEADQICIQEGHRRMG